MAEKYQVMTHGMNGRYGVVNSTIPFENDERVIVTVDSESRARIIVDELNSLQHQIEEKPLNLHEDFQEWENCIERINKTSRRLMEIKEIYQLESDRLLEEAREIKIDFKALYGGNNATTRKQYVDEQLSDLLEEKKELTFLKDEDNRKISFLKRLIDMKIELIKYNGE